MTHARHCQRPLPFRWAARSAPDPRWRMSTRRSLRDFTPFFGFSQVRVFSLSISCFLLGLLIASRNPFRHVRGKGSRKRREMERERRERERRERVRREREKKKRKRKEKGGRERGGRERERRERDRRERERERKEGREEGEEKRWSSGASIPVPLANPRTFAERAIYQLIYYPDVMVTDVPYNQYLYSTQRKIHNTASSFLPKSPDSRPFQQLAPLSGAANPPPRTRKAKRRPPVRPQDRRQTPRQTGRRASCAPGAARRCHPVSATLPRSASSARASRACAGSCAVMPTSGSTRSRSSTCRQSG